MPLSRHLEQGRLLYWTRNPDAISVNENSHYRWLAFGDVIQSVMNKRAPNRLTLPHQYALLLPLGYFSATHVIEFGLGGGNISRFINTWFPNINHKIIERNGDVIYCFHQYFEPKKLPIEVIHSSAERWFSTTQGQERQCQQGKKEWFIYDIYQHQDEQIAASNSVLYQLIEALTEQQLLSVNLPFVEPFELNSVLDNMRRKFTTHQIAIYRVPHYRNKVIHLVPKQCLLPKTSSGLLPMRLRKYWRKYEQLFRIPSE